MPHRRERLVAPSGSPSAEVDPRGANEAKVEKLRRNDLQHRAGLARLELRPSAYGCALIDSARQRVEDRSDMALDEIESCLQRG